jgi:hypothetical protein
VVKHPTVLIASLGASLLLNLSLALVLFLNWFNSPSGELGVLQHEVVARAHGEKLPLELRLPRGLTVRNEDPRGLAAIGMFEPYRFSVVLTTESPELVRYGLPEKEMNPSGELYSVVAPAWPPAQ